MNSTALTVNFHGQDLFIIEHNGQPYTPMKTIVENMGLAWQPQLAKLNANPQRWGITKIVIPTLGNLQEAVCMPLRKLFGWLSTISPNKVKPELREKIIFYQNECDDVLWEHWTKHQPKPYGLKELKPTYASVKMERHVSEMVCKYAAETGRHHNTVYDEIKTKFEFQKIGEIPVLTYPEICTHFGQLPKYDIPRTVTVDILDAGKAEKYQTLLQIERGELKALPAQELQALENKKHSAFIDDYDHFREYLDKNSEMGFRFVRKSDLYDLGLKILDMGI